MNRAQLVEIIKTKKSYLCIGLDTDIEKIPGHLKNCDDPLFAFNKAIIDATHDIAAAYKPNIAFYERHGAKGWQSLEKTIRYLDTFGETVFTIADAKRGDIGNTAAMYAKAFLADPPDGLGFDAITVAPYMGCDSVKPFLDFKNKWAILLALTSNAGADDFQRLKLEEGGQLFELVIRKSHNWGTIENLMFVVGATQAKMLAYIRKMIPGHFLLIPGVGAQGGSLKDVSEAALTADCGLLVNSSRGIIYASSGEKFAEKARENALELQQQMKTYMKLY